MKISLVRTGGVGGIRRQITLDTSELPKKEEKQLRNMIATASFYELPEKIRSTESGADRFCYQIGVEEGDSCKSVWVEETAVPESLLPLLGYLMRGWRTKRT
jgi:hypothetical protein